MHTKLILGGLAAVWLLGVIADHSSESSQALMDLLMVLGQPQRPVLLGHSTSRVSHPFAQSPGSSLAGCPVCSSLSHRVVLCMRPSSSRSLRAGSSFLSCLVFPSGTIVGVLQVDRFVISCCGCGESIRKGKELPPKKGMISCAVRGDVLGPAAAPLQFILLLSGSCE